MSGYLSVLQRVQQATLRAGRKIDDVLLIGVTKGHPVQDIQKLYHQGLRNFGESKVQEALPKIDHIATDARWHLIGSLQKNKVIKVVGKFVWIHSVDSFELAEKISSVSASKGVISNVLLEVNTSGEKSKHGLSCEEWRTKMEGVLKLPSLQVGGFMTMAPLTDDLKVIRKTFSSLRVFRDEVNKEFRVGLPHLSMGMSHDFEIAIEEGATMVRVGSALFSGTGTKKDQN